MCVFNSGNEGVFGVVIMGVFGEIILVKVIIFVG